MLPDSTRNYMSKFLDDAWMVEKGLEPASILTSARRAATIDSARGGGGGASGRSGGGKPTTAAGSGGGGNKLTAKERMTQLKELLDAGLVSQTEYDGKRAEILANI